MSVSRIEPLALDAFSSQVLAEPEQLVLTMTGNADLRARKDLDTLLKDVHQEAVRLAVRQVIVDVTRLEFMNSSCFKAIVAWLTDIMELPEAGQYRVRFRSNPDTLWQRRSLHALRSYALMIVKIE